MGKPSKSKNCLPNFFLKNCKIKRNGEKHNAFPLLLSLTFGVAKHKDISGGEGRGQNAGGKEKKHTSITLLHLLQRKHSRCQFFSIAVKECSCETGAAVFPSSWTGQGQKQAL